MEAMHAQPGEGVTTLTQMERTATGWRCPRCGDTREDDILPMRVVECNCTGLGVPEEDDLLKLAREIGRICAAVEAVTGIPDGLWKP